MADDEDKAFLHIVHISDIHCRSAGGPTDLATERIVQAFVALLRRMSPKSADFVESYWEQGLAGHDPEAHERFCAFLKWFANEPGFQGVETWLVDTGDLSSMGDMSSLTTAKDWLNAYRKILGAKKLFSIYGNHDAWPGTFPLRASFKDLRQHRDALRAGLFKGRWPRGALSARIPGTKSKLLLYALNSVIDDRWYNTFARGEVAGDPWWAAQDIQAGQLAEFAHDMEKNFHADGKTRDFRILAIHHPVHYPPPRSKWTMSLMNDQAVANALIEFDKKERGKLAHLVLSGHTHETYPGIGKLPGNAVGTVYKPLASGQLQLVAGSLAQAPRDADRASTTVGSFIPHQCQILTFWARSGTADRMLEIERRIVGRPGGTGKYKILTSPPSSGGVETIRIEY